MSKKVKRTFQLIGMWTWELPQSLLGAIILLFLTDKQDGGLFLGRRVVWFKKGKFFSGTSLGYFILLPYGSGVKTTAHEWGHCMQSKKSGPLYLVIYGIPSLQNNLEARSNEWTYENYYELYPERDADLRAGIVVENGDRVYKGAA